MRENHKMLVVAGMLIAALAAVVPSPVAAHEDPVFCTTTTSCTFSCVLGFVDVIVAGTGTGTAACGEDVATCEAGSFNQHACRDTEPNDTIGGGSCTTTGTVTVTCRTGA